MGGGLGEFYRDANKVLQVDDNNDLPPPTVKMTSPSLFCILVELAKSLRCILTIY